MKAECVSINLADPLGPEAARMICALTTELRARYEGDDGTGLFNPADATRPRSCFSDHLDDDGRGVVPPGALNRGGDEALGGISCDGFAGRRPQQLEQLVVEEAIHHSVRAQKEH